MKTNRNLRSRQTKSGQKVHSPEAMELSLMKMVATGDLAKPGRQAVRNTRKQGLPVTFQRGSKIVKQYADGREEVLGKVEMIKFRLPKGVRIIGEK